MAKLSLPHRHVALALATSLLLLLAVVAPALRANPADEPTKQPVAGEIRHVILISVDGLRPDAITAHDEDDLPNFYRLRREGAFTDNARTDAHFSVTLPNHIAQLTGRPVAGEAGHNWTFNRDPEPGTTLHSNRGAYVPSVFDVVHDHGLRTGAYVSKSKFSLLDDSYDMHDGAPDVTGRDDGRDKIDAFVYEKDTDDLVDTFIQHMELKPFSFAFVHLRDPDHMGHIFGWSLWKHGPYMRAVREADENIGDILDAIERDPQLAAHTIVIVTADHGGSGRHHDERDADHYTIPFYVWGASVPSGDLYAVNATNRQNPGTDQLDFTAARQPIRNGAAGNLALSLLGLQPIPGSTINGMADLLVARPAGGAASASR